MCSTLFGKTCCFKVGHLENPLTSSFANSSIKCGVICWFPHYVPGGRRICFAQALVIAGGIAVFLINAVYFDKITTSKTHSWRTSVPEPQTDGAAVNTTSEIIFRIISWTPNFYRLAQRPWFKEGRDAFKGCTLPEGVTCEYFQNKSLYKSSDAVLFSARFLNDTPLPTFRPPGQFWIFKERESPVYMASKVNLESFARLFNASFTYSYRSDIVMPHGKCIRKDSSNSDTEYVVSDIASRKTELAAWFVSRCKSQSRREDYAEELRRYIPVHVYGECGQYNCSKDDDLECDQLLAKNYKFYLAFENSLCEDYMTEKFWKCFELDIIPVVYGLAAYGRYAPKHSFIDIRDFASPKLLAQYLLLLDKNNTLYNEYFAWKSTHKCGRLFSYPQCQICRLLHETTHAKESHPPLDVAKAWDKNLHCQDLATFRNKCKCWPYV